MSFTDPGAGPYTYIISWGDGSANSTGNVATVKPFTVTHTYAPGAYQVFVTITNGAGGSVSQRIAFSIVDVAPTATYTAPTPLEGSPYVLTLTKLKAPAPPISAGITYQFDCGQGAGLQPGDAGNPAQLTCPAAYTGTFATRGIVSDSFGGSTSYAKTVAVKNVAPTVTATPISMAVSIGSSDTINASFTDPGPDGPWTYTAVWGDGTPNTTGSVPAPAPGAIPPFGGSLPPLGHRYTNAGSYLVTVSVKDHGNATGSAAPITITVTPLVPGVPNPVSATLSGANAVQLTWSAVSGSTSYNVFRATTSGAEALPALASPTGTGYTDNSTTPGQTYYYVIQACNAGGCSANSGEVSATLPPAAPSAQVSPGAATSGQLALSWSAVSGATYYAVGESGTSGGPYAVLNPPQTTTSLAYTDTETSGSPYYYVVQACNTGGCSAPSGQVSAIAP